jgi:hypothetical protein
MADTYVPGMEFQSWRSLPRLRDAAGSASGMLIGGLIDALSGSSVGSELMSGKKKDTVGVPPLDTSKMASMQPVAPTDYSYKGKLPSAWADQNQLGVPPVPSTNIVTQPTQPQIGGYRRFLDMPQQ